MTTTTTPSRRIEIRPAHGRGTTDLGWLDSRHSFSFGRYHDPARMGEGPLRVINDDRVAPAGGFPEHPHQDMEILSWIVSGALAHRDSTGSAHVAGPGTLQAMTAGAGIRHSEYNASRTEPVRFLQIWILPDRAGLPPAYRQRDFSADIAGRLVPIATPTGEGGSIAIHQDVRVLATRLAPGQAVRHEIARGRRAYVQVVSGTIDLAGASLSEGDAAVVSDAGVLDLTAKGAPAEALLFDLSA